MQTTEATDCTDKKFQDIDSALGRASDALWALCVCFENYGEEALGREAAQVADSFHQRQRVFQNLRASAQSADKERSEA